MSALARMDGDDRPRDDRVNVLEGAAWSDFVRLRQIRGDRSGPRLAYFQGRLEIMSPSWNHELLKSRLGSLIEAWCEERGVDCEKLGSWTLEREVVNAGVEPDECFVVGPAASQRPPPLPDLAVEVVWTSGGLDKLAVYAALGLREVWVWRKGEVQVHRLREGHYEVGPSEVLPGVDVALLTTLIEQTPWSAAIRAWREAIRRS